MSTSHSHSTSFFSLRRSSRPPDGYHHPSYRILILNLHSLPFFQIYLIFFPPYLPCHSRFCDVVHVRRDTATSLRHTIHPPCNYRLQGRLQVRLCVCLVYLSLPVCTCLLSVFGWQFLHNYQVEPTWTRGTKPSIVNCQLSIANLLACRLHIHPFVFFSKSNFQSGCHVLCLINPTLSRFVPKSSLVASGP